MANAGGERPFADGTERPVCGVCPSTRLPGGAFDVHPRPSPESRFANGMRRTPSGVPVCVHPQRVGLPPAAYASAAAPLPWRTPPPPEPAALTAWLRQALTSAPPDACDEVLAQAAAALRAAHPTADVTAALRAALSGPE
ncbi:hypothetical protein [Actinacidiphila yeochonensis]|uniref:hypothetical protein n=1 Tax=Actinacidiphila yeochonensis TaxID=89050 RepID=UPI0005687956|nr:hypothetical protein [Actinacidiphila yeochonensis]